MSLTLTVLAAGMGSRYGGLKQLDPVGPAGETVLDYAVHDARRAGFDRVVFVIRRDFDPEFRARIGARYENSIRVDYVHQSLEAMAGGLLPPPARVKPWGTGHAVWCARAALDGPFAVINADDFYGRDSFVRLADFLRSAPATDGDRVRYAMVGFRLENTLSEHGAVSRGVCQVSAAGTLESVTEHTGIVREAVGAGRQFRGDEIVSMNCWGFTPALFPALERRLLKFWQAQDGGLTSEFYLPAAVSALIAGGEAEVRVLPTTASWFGVTYREDRPGVVETLRALVASGEYPASLSLHTGPTLAS
jgi:hypothetical protein